jgi:hypothetical protein
MQMLEHRVADWDNAYANGDNIAGSNRWPAAWDAPAQAFRDTLSAAANRRLEAYIAERGATFADI